MQTDPAWKDNLLFYEYFHGDNGAGLGAIHQTGWTALVADLLLDPPRRVRRMIFYDETTTHLTCPPSLRPSRLGPRVRERRHAIRFEQDHPPFSLRDQHLAVA